MRRPTRTILTVLAALVVVLGLGGAVVASSDGSTVTRARLERTLPVVFANLYVDQTRILGRDGVTAASLHPHAMCDKHGPDVADVGAGGDWVCLMSWDDPAVPMPPEGYGKFELNVHSNGCFTAAGPTKLTGFLTLTDTTGRDVTNPVFEFDGCFDPNGDNNPTGVSFPSVLNVTSSTLAPDPQGDRALQITCGTGSAGCSGTITVTGGKESIGTIAYDLREESSATLPLPPLGSSSATELTFALAPTAGVVSSDAVTLPLG